MAVLTHIYFMVLSHHRSVTYLTSDVQNQINGLQPSGSYLTISSAIFNYEPKGNYQLAGSYEL